MEKSPGSSVTLDYNLPWCTKGDFKNKSGDEQISYPGELNMGMLIAGGPGRPRRVGDQGYNVDLAPYLNCPQLQDVYI